MSHFCHSGAVKKRCASGRGRGEGGPGAGASAGGRHPNAGIRAGSAGAHVVVLVVTGGEVDGRSEYVIIIEKIMC